MEIDDAVKQQAQHLLSTVCSTQPPSLISQKEPNGINIMWHSQGICVTIEDNGNWFVVGWDVKNLGNGPLCRTFDSKNQKEAHQFIIDNL
jgi:hypothetical protein